MPGEWKQAVTLCFRGKRFEGHALDVGALSELAQFQKLVAETAEVLWRKANPDRKNLPAHFKERTRLCLRKIEKGSAKTPLEVFLEEPEERELWEPEPVELQESIDLAHRVFDSIEHDHPLPEEFPKELIGDYHRWGRTLSEDEEIEFTPVGKNGVKVRSETRERLACIKETSYTDSVDISGEVVQVSVREQKRRFYIRTAEDAEPDLSFSDDQEALVTTALKDHRTLRVRVMGRGLYSHKGELLRIIEVSDLKIEPLDEVPFDKTVPPIWEKLEEISKQVPKEEWDRLPPDLSDNLDHYIYGTPKK